MSVMTTGLVSPRYRHFFPVAPNLTIPLGGLKSVGLSGGVKVVRAYGTTQETDTQYIYHIGSQFAGSLTSDINLYIDGVYQVNNYGFFGKTVPLYDVNGNPRYDPVTKKPIVRNIFEYELFNYVDDNNTIVLTSRAKKPKAGTPIKVDMLMGDAEQESTLIPMKKYLLQGLDPIDKTLVNHRDPHGQYFQGAYRCFLEIVTKPVHGVMTITDDKMGFVYRPEIGYFGDDVVTYRIVNCMGQQSPCATITFQVGTIESVVQP